MRAIYLLTIFTFTLLSPMAYEFEGCDTSPTAHQQTIFYSHMESVADPLDFVLMPQAFYQLKLVQKAEVDDQGNFLVPPKWEPLGLCMLSKEGKMIPYNLSSLVYPEWKFELVENFQLNLDGTVRYQAVYHRYVLDDVANEDGTARWMASGYYQAGKEVSWNAVQAQQKKSFSSFHKLLYKTVLELPKQR